MSLDLTAEENKEKLEKLKNNIDILKNAKTFDVLNIWYWNYILHSIDFNFSEINLYYFTSNWYQYLSLSLSDLCSKDIKKEQDIGRIKDFYSELEHEIIERTEFQRQIEEKYPDIFKEINL